MLNAQQRLEIYETLLEGGIAEIVWDLSTCSLPHVMGPSSRWIVIQLGCFWQREISAVSVSGTSTLPKTLSKYGSAKSLCRMDLTFIFGETDSGELLSTKLTKKLFKWSRHHV